jgi:hypothetical protein
MESTLTRSLYLDREPLAAAGIVHVFHAYGRGLSSFKQESCKLEKHIRIN